MKKLTLSVLLLLLLSFPYSAWSTPPYVMASNQVIDSGTCTLKDAINTGDTGFSTVGKVGFESLALTDAMTEAYTVDKIRLYLAKQGTPTGNMTIYAYTPPSPSSKGAPDDRQATSTTTIDVSTISASRILAL
jgi:hypothetical protein